MRWSIRSPTSRYGRGLILTETPSAIYSAFDRQSQLITLARRLAATGYVRNRPLEFADTSRIPKDELLKVFDERD